MATTDTPVSELIINNLTQAQYDAILQPSDTELYLVPDEVDSAPTSGSNNYVTSGGVYTALQDKTDKVSNPTNGNFAALDSSGNLTDSGHKHSDYLTSHQDISGKADKVSNATNGNFAALDSNGNLTDSGHKHSDYLTSQQNADWNATSGAAKILNKPTIPDAVSGTNDGTNWTSITIGSTTKNVPSGGSTTLSGLTDTTITSASNGQVIAYNSTTSKWENSTSNPKLTAVLSYTEIPPVSEGDEPTFQLGCSESISTIISTITNGGYNAVQFFMNVEGAHFLLNLVSIENNAIFLIGTGFDTSYDFAELAITGISENNTDTWSVEWSWNSLEQSMAVKEFLDNYDPSVVPVQSDWDEGDSSKMSFVKNRTHYVDYFNRNEYTNPCIIFVQDQYNLMFGYSEQNPDFSSKYGAILQYLKDVYGSLTNYNCFSTYLKVIKSLSINNIYLFTNYANIHTLSNEFLTELEQIDQSLADNLNSSKYYIGNVKTFINVQFLNGTITSQVKDSAFSLVEQYQTDNDFDVDFMIAPLSPYYYMGFLFITDNSINNYDLSNNPTWEVTVGIPSIIKLPLSFLPLPHSTGDVDNRKKLIMLNGEYVLSEDYGFTHTQYQTTNNSVVVTYAANTRGSRMVSASADLSVTFAVNNSSDNYLWIKNTGSSDIDILISSVTYNNSSVSNVYMPDGSISVPAGKVCEIGIVCNADGAFITSRSDLSL